MAVKKYFWTFAIVRFFFKLKRGHSKRRDDSDNGFTVLPKDPSHELREEI